MEVSSNVYLIREGVCKWWVLEEVEIIITHSFTKFTIYEYYKYSNSLSFFYTFLFSQEKILNDWKMGELIRRGYN